MRPSTTLSVFTASDVGGGGRRWRSLTLTRATATMASLFSASMAAPRARAAGGGGRRHLRLHMPARAIAITPGGMTTSRPHRTATTLARAIATPPGWTTMSRTPSQHKRADPIARAAGGGGRCCLCLGTPARAIAIAPGGMTMLRPRRTATAPARAIAPPSRTDNNAVYTISGQEGGHPGGVVGVDNAGSRFDVDNNVFK